MLKMIANRNKTFLFGFTNISLSLSEYLSLQRLEVTARHSDKPLKSLRLNHIPRCLTAVSVPSEYVRHSSCIPSHSVGFP